MSRSLVEILRLLNPSGSEGFEGLIALLLESLTGRHFSLARSGSQEGRDMSSRQVYANVLAVECKRYGQDATLDERGLLGELVEATQSIPDLDLWVLVVSRDVPSQLCEKLHTAAVSHAIEFFSISSEDGTPSSLEALCAYSPDVVASHPAVQRVARPLEVSHLLSRIAEHPQFQRRISTLKSTFSSPLVGYENWRLEQNRWFACTLLSEQEARASFGQTINVEDKNIRLIERNSAWSAMSKWLENWHADHRILVVLGEEGDGKTWSVVSWLSQSVKKFDQFPAVIFFSSTDVDIQDPMDLLAKAISRRLGQVSEGQSRRRLNRWMSKSGDKAPLFLIVFDGINERRSSDWWRTCLEKFAGEPWVDHVAIIVTCRTSYWRRYFDSLSHLLVSELIIPPYDDIELDAALAGYKLFRDDIPNNLMPLIRKPRYFDLMVKHRVRVAESGDITVARLIYEDWRDRLERKRNFPIGDEDFQNLIRKLSCAHRKKRSVLSEQEVADILPVFLDKPSIFEELRTGGVLKAQKGTYQVDERLLIYGLGLLLVDQLEQAAQENRDLKETVAGWLEPYAEIDIKASVCEFAALHALGLKDLPRDVKVALLQAWIDARNHNEKSESSFTAYLPVDPESYSELAESIWSDAYDNTWAQEILVYSFLRWYESPRVSCVLMSAFEKWLGFVHVYGSPIFRKTPEDAESVKGEISQRIGSIIQEGPFSFADYNLTAIKDDGQLRLGRAALAIISHFPRNQFIHAIAIGCIAEAIMGWPDKYDLFAWVIRTSPQTIWPDIFKEVKHLLAFDNIITKQAAYRLLSFEGGENAYHLGEKISRNIFPSDTMLERHRKDPCTSGFSWTEEDCIPCLQREDLAVEWVAKQINEYCLDPSLPMTSRLKSQFASLALKIEPSTVWTTMMQTSADYFFNACEPVLAAYAPSPLSDLVGSIVRQIVTRQGTARRQLSFRLKEHYLIFRSGENDAIHRAWDQIISIANGWGESEETAEMFLFKLVLIEMTAENQLASLLRRPVRAHDLIEYKTSFQPITDWGSVREAFALATSSRALARILWFISAYPLSVPHDIIADHVISALDHEDSYVRSLALEIIYGTKEIALIKMVIERGWRWSKSFNDNENHWGSLVLCEAGMGIAFAELFRRIHPAYLGHAVVCRGNQPCEVDAYAEVVHQVLSRLSTSIHSASANLLDCNIDSTFSSDAKQINRLSLPKSTFSRTITFRNPHATWGGSTGNELDLRELISDDFSERKNRLLQILRETIEQQKAAGNIWFGRVVRPNELEKVVELRPDLTAQWISTALSDASDTENLFANSSSFYEALCRILFQKQEEKAVALYWKIQEARTRLRVVDKDTEFELLDFALFSASPSDALKEAWKRKLEHCNTDMELMEVAILSQHGSGKDWLWVYINSGISSTVPIDRARALTLLGFFDSPDASEALNRLLESQPDTWLRRLVKKSSTRSKRNNWAKHWYHLFLTDKDNTQAWASFRLFLRCVDRRFWLWRNAIKTDAGDGYSNKDRLAFFKDNLNCIHDSIRDNEKELSKEFLGQKVLEREAWPWM